MTIVEAQPAEINQLKASGTFEREAEVIQPKYIRLLDNQTDEGTSYACSSIKNVSRTFYFEKDDEIFDTNLSLRLSSSLEKISTDLRPFEEVTLSKPSLDQEGASVLIRRDEKPAEADVFIEIYRPESVFTYELTIVTPQMFIGFADVVGTKITNEMIINVVEELTKMPDQEDKEIVLREKAKIRSNVSYKWILARKDGETHKKDVWTLQRVRVLYEKLTRSRSEVHVLGSNQIGKNLEDNRFFLKIVKFNFLRNLEYSSFRKNHKNSKFRSKLEEIEFSQSCG